MQCCFAECRIKTHAALVLTDQWAPEGLDEENLPFLYSAHLWTKSSLEEYHSWRAHGLISFRWIQGILLMEASPMWLLVTPNSEAWSLQSWVVAFLMWNNQILLEGNSPRVKKTDFTLHLYWNLIGWQLSCLYYTLRVSFIYTPGRMMTLHLTF